MDALETFQFLDRARDAGYHITDIELNYLVGITAACILYVDGGGNLPVIHIDFMAAQLQIAILESGVAQSIAEWIERTIAYIQTIAGKLGKFLIVIRYWSSRILMIVVERLLSGCLWHGSGELT